MIPLYMRIAYLFSCSIPVCLDAVERTPDELAQLIRISLYKLDPLITPFLSLGLLLVSHPSISICKVLGLMLYNLRILAGCANEWNKTILQSVTV